MSAAKRFFLFILLSYFYADVSAQADGAFLPRATNLLKNQPATEKVYLHLDKQDYGFGDTIWYKAYTVIGEHHQLSALSGVLYVELISPKDSLITRQIIPLVSGVGWSDIPLAHTLKQGIYRLRAYTNWMRNAGPDYFYNQKIRIGGIPADLNAERLTTQTNPDVQFFPEGGELVNGIRSRVAFKAINAKGLGENIKGTIIDYEGNIVVDFAARHLGMGVFAFTPQSGKTYKARINGIGEASFIVDLPKAQDAGYMLSVNNSLPDSIFIKIAVNDKTFSEQKDSIFYIIAQSAGKIYFTAQGKLEGMVYSAKVERNRFPSGIAQFTLFSQSGEPLAERIAFIQNKDTLKLNMAVPAQVFAIRQHVKINLDAKDPDDNSIAGSFSVSVINDSQAATDNLAETTILNNLLLTSNLKGYIEQPNYYFINPNEQTLSDLDVLMLTQGYRRFDWMRALTNSIPPMVYQPERSLELAGTLKTRSGKPVPNGKINLMATKQNVLRDTATDAEGHFKFNGLFFTDTTGIVLKARKENKNDNVMIAVNQPDYPAIIPANKTVADGLYIAGQATDILQKKYIGYQQAQKQDYLKNGVQLKQVNIKGYKQKKPDLSNSSNLNGPGHANQVIMGDQVDRCITLSDCLDGKILGVIFARDGTPLNTRSPIPSPLTIIVDGIVMDGYHLNEINAADIYSIEVLRSGSYLAVYGSNASNGALVITMKHGGETIGKPANYISSGLITFPFIGYYKARTFYSPKYNGPKTDKQPADERSTIYWNPNILTDKNGKASFEYFNNDTKGTYRVVVEGIDDNGNLGRAVYRYKVE